MNDFFQLQQPLTDGATRSVNFFNGRLLSANDLTREQSARHDAEARLGLAIGDGIAQGLQVSESVGDSTAQAPVVAVQPGLAINRMGQALRLSSTAKVALTRKLDTTSANDCVFTDCGAIGDGSYIAGAGVYVLTMAPAEQAEGKAATNGLDPSNVRCNTDATVEAVQFRLLTVDASLLNGLDFSDARFRSRLAALCLGSAQFDITLGALGNPIAPTYGLIDQLRSGALSDYDVPLALLAWTAAGLDFVDLWSVRRGIASLAGAGEPWAPRAAAEGEARFRQFQAQLADFSGSATPPSTLRAVDHFEYLPAAGLLPTSPTQDGQDFDYTTFFDGLTVRAPVYLEGAAVAQLLRRSWLAPAERVDGGTLWWLYWLRQNGEGIADGSGAWQMLLFSSGELPFEALTRYDVYHFDYANFL